MKGGEGREEDTQIELFISVLFHSFVTSPSILGENSAHTSCPSFTFFSGNCVSVLWNEPA